MLHWLDMKSIYFDHNATTPLDPKVRDVMLPYLDEIWGNPSSVHQIGQRARAALDDARDRAAHLLKCRPSEVVFTSGGTEANNLAILGVARLRKGRGRHLITSAIEHHAVLHCFDYLAQKEGFDVTRLPVDRKGHVSPDDLSKAIRPETTLVSIQAANNEIGTIQPVAHLGALCRQRGVLFHTDAVQWFGKEPVTDIHQFNADLVSICAHKFHGPKGAGLLFIKSPLLPDPILFGGGHENERRAGTENLPAIVGLVAALEWFVPEPVFRRPALTPLADVLRAGIKSLPGTYLVGDSDQGLANTVSFLVDGAESIALLAGLDLEGICASSGSACSAGALGSSHVIEAIGVAPQLARALVRFSLGRQNSPAEVARVSAALPAVIQRARHVKQRRTAG